MKNIILTGFMGTGKTYIGKLLAHRLKYKYIDTDEIIEHQTGMKIKDIFEKYGETYFRDLETKVVKKVSKLNNCVIATGGGIVLRKENMDELEKNGFIVNLKAKPETIYKRIKNNTDRPLLNKPDPKKEIQKLLKIRKPYYERCNLSVETDKESPEEIIKFIINQLGVKIV